MDWIDLITRLGAPALFIYLAGKWFVGWGWPFITKAWEDQQTERKEERRNFISVLDAFRVDMLTVERENRAVHVETRDMFLKSIDEYREQLEKVAVAQEVMVATQKEMIETQKKIQSALEKKE